MVTRSRQTYLTLIAGISLMLVACSAGAPTTPGPGGASAAPPRPVSTAAAAVVPTSNAPAPAASSVASGGACTILDKAAVSHATGFTVTQTNGTDAICYYQSADQSQYLVVTLYGNQADMATIMEIEPGGDHVAGLGDDAFWVASGGILFVRKGDHAIELLDPDASAGTGGTKSRDALVALARDALPNV